MNSIRIRCTLAVVLLTLLVSGLAAGQSTIAVTSSYQQSVRGTIDGQAFLVLRGTARERGQAYGYLAAREILALFSDSILPTINERMPGGWDAMILPASARFQFPERFEQELAGMLEGLTMALPDEADRTPAGLGRPISLEDLKAFQCAADILGMGCSSFAAWGPLTSDGRIIAARNLDYVGFAIGSNGLILVEEPAEAGLLATLEVSAFGSVGLGTGINAEGVYVSIHDGNSRKKDLTRPFVARGLALRIACETASAGQAAESVAGTLKEQGNPSMGTNINVVEPIRPGESASLPAVLEWDGAGAAIRRPEEGKSYIASTNHFVQQGSGRNGESEGRLAKLSASLETSQNVDFDQARNLLKSVCRSGRLTTHMSVIAWPDQRKLAVAYSPKPGASAVGGTWITVTLEQLLAVQPQQ